MPSVVATTRRVTIPAGIEPVALLGASDHVLRAIERGFPHVRFIVMGREITMSGQESDVDLAAQLIVELITVARSGVVLDVASVEYALSLLSSAAMAERAGDEILSVRGRSIRPKSPGQKS